MGVLMDFLLFLSEVGTNELVKAIADKNSILLTTIPIVAGLILKVFAILGPNTLDNRVRTMLQGIAARKKKDGGF